MKRDNIPLIVLGIVILLSVCLTSCGGGPSSSDTGTASVAADPPAATPAVTTPAPAAPAPAVTTPTPTPVTPAPTPAVVAPAPVNSPAPVTQVPTPTVTPVVSTPAPIANASTAGIWTIDVPVPTVPDFTFTMFASDTGALFYKYYFAILPDSYNVLEDEYAGMISASVDTLSGSQNEADTIDPTRNCAASNTYCAYTNDPPGAQPITGSIAPGASITINGATWTASQLYDDPSPLSAIEGQWSGYFTGTGQALNATTLTITADGSFLEQDPGSDCLVGGQFSTDDPMQNLYSVSWTYSGSDCLTGLSSATGDAYLDYSVDPIVLHIMAQTAPTGDIVAVSEMPVSGT